jgi:hypothetical protein
VVSADQIARLATGQEEGDGIAERIDQSVDLVPSPPRDRPIAWASPSFSGAGAALAGAMVLSIIANSRKGRQHIAKFLVETLRDAVETDSGTE